MTLLQKGGYMDDREKVDKSKEFGKVTKRFIHDFGENIAICSYDYKDKECYAVFQFHTSYNDFHAVQAYPIRNVGPIKKILFTCGLAVNHAAKLIKVKGAKDA